MCGSPALHGFAFRRYRFLAAAVLALAAFNLGFRMSAESVTDWDEAIYATSAAEMVESNQWIATTYLGKIDYYNTKPPLNVWLIAGAYKILGLNLFALRISAAISAWLTVAVLQLWLRRVLGPTRALFATLILSTSFAFFHVHSGRSANTDALFTLLVLLTAITTWASRKTPACSVWLGPILAAVFLLRGFGVLMPLAMVLAAEVWLSASGQKRSWPAFLFALVLFIAPVAAWAILRWNLDGAAFLSRVFAYDFVARSVAVIEGHQGSAFYYLNILQKHQLEWMLLAVLSLLAGGLRFSVEASPDHRWFGVVVAIWAGATLGIPTLMRTKLPWYLNTFYPVFAVVLALLLARAFVALPTNSARRKVFAIGLLIVALTAETRLVWYSFQFRDLRSSTQGWLLAEGPRVVGRRVFRDSWSESDRFVLQKIAGGEARDLADPARFMQESDPGDYLLATERIHVPGLVLLRSGPDYRLYRRAS